MIASLRSVDDHGVHYQALAFVCPGCALMPGGGEGFHMLPVTPRPVGPSWTFNGDLERPTLTPSILTKGREDHRCHSYITDGSIQFLPDSTHPLAGQTVPLPPLPEWLT